MTEEAPATSGPPDRAQGRLKCFLLRYFGVREGPSPLHAAMWADADAQHTPPPGTDGYRTAVLEQYKIYVEMADRVSARRGTSNTFFLTLNTIIFTAIGVFWQGPPIGSAWLLVVPWLVLVGQCLSWFWLLRSYRQLNSAKYKVIGLLEERLPASPYWRAEWSVLAFGRDPAVYWPLSHIEQWIPALFAAAYTGGLLLLLMTSS